MSRFDGLRFYGRWPTWLAVLLFNGTFRSINPRERELGCSCSLLGKKVLRTGSTGRNEQWIGERSWPVLPPDC